MSSDGGYEESSDGQLQGQPPKYNHPGRIHVRHDPAPILGYNRHDNSVDVATAPRSQLRAGTSAAPSTLGSMAHSADFDLQPNSEAEWEAYTKAKHTELTKLCQSFLQIDNRRDVKFLLDSFNTHENGTEVSGSWEELGGRFREVLTRIKTAPLNSTLTEDHA
ncbi:uncharacterized protein I303_107688 [Kwoniella dejecticola CBS 10117]|uniref:Uncharacterized protein n=1 Tax=Kwoniella dejecticola CBS 10117 TaxID=1296121 RepID=A0A1A5ZVF2_9TREE|nr:uncharacterized protein I303_07697 [Kwoniella dejecticola CBS 10117]OBR81787.1 hypothetical protein I303_07697 [Kwoniella dejecticola CBS 10117]